ncbi:unnamed protein product (macronuclear) [Paramecium tetraurelia]|uniref:Phospholipid/glycerol acyltransferase domain-containing protein n=1 Tax=Paramecium tetraurelia TaxID=5888 RepID=A0EC22_PARTE|nr:uncharacterized protein GSPATT00025575001 [Paramecium tetraurelia]CAK92839.1 unnamed protein product [Paramecium tetraurelia]|eukprot:XP_001460236.1 hypothetical protein (macronuclear) [Paramecium tetraurelia strain d4-2]
MNPFLPKAIPKGSRIKTILECVLLSIRLPIFLGLTLQIIIFNDLLFRKLQNQEFRQSVHKFIRIIILLHNFFIGRALLLLMGFYNVKSMFSNSAQNQKPQNLQSYSLLCSRTSPIDVFTLITYFSPSFTHVSLYKRRVRYQLISYYQAIIDSFQIEKCGFKMFRSGKDIRELMELIDKQRSGPLIVFWEGGVSNGQHFLKIDELMIKEASKINSYSKQRQHVAKYNSSNPTGLLSILTNSRVLLVGNSWMRMLYNLLVNWSCGLQMHFLRVPYFVFSDCRFGEFYNQFVHNMLMRKLSKKNWMDYRTKFIRDIN